jgi:hypothetical protein
MDKDELAALDRAATQGDTNALIDLEMALVTLYRAGKLVLIDDGVVERVAKAAHETLSRLDVDAYLAMPFNTADDLARAALAALGVK